MLGFTVPVGLGWRLVVGAPIVLIRSLAGASFQASRATGCSGAKSSSSLTAGQARYAVVGVLAAALILWAFLPDHRVTGAFLIAAAIAERLAARPLDWLRHMGRETADHPPRRICLAGARCPASRILDL